MSEDVIKVFRFRPISERLWQEIELGNLFACSPNQLNDPLDCQIDPIPSLKRALDSTDDNDRSEKIQFVLERFLETPPGSKPIGTICFTNSMSSHVMWSHYANQHCGVCLMYEIPVDYFPRVYSHERGNNFFFVGMSPVEYGENAFFRWLTHGDLDKPEHGQPGLNAATQLLRIKGVDWEYENEYRIIFSKPGVVTVDTAFLKQVAFGFRVPDNYASLIKRSVERNSPDAKFCRAHRNPDKDLGFIFKDE